MSEKDPIEELFRREAEESLFQDKPREVVWQKIESNLHTKTEAPIKSFIQSVWFSAAVFALIAVPYFYFFLENMNHRDNTIDIVRHSVEEIVTPRNENNEIQTELDNIILESPEIVKNENNRITREKKEDNILEKSSDIQKIDEVGNIGVEQSSKIVLNAEIDTLLLAKNNAKESPVLLSPASASVDTVLLAANTSVSLDDNRSRAKVAVKEVSPLSFQRNKFIIQDKLNRISFEFVKKNNNRLIFDKEGIKLTLVRENGQVKILTNTKNIKPEILSQIQSNKELIYNYYVNFEASKNK